MCQATRSDQQGPQFLTFIERFKIVVLANFYTNYTNYASPMVMGQRVDHGHSMQLGRTREVKSF